MSTRLSLTLFAAAWSALAPSAGAADFPPRRVLLIAGEDDSHPPGTHEYAETVAALAEMLRGSNVGESVEVTTAVGWPADPAALGRADCVFLYSAGGNHDEVNHPFLKAGRWAQVEAAAARGCGVVLLHWSTFLPDRLHDSAMRVVGGRFDYEGGDHPKGWQSRIDFATAPVAPATPGHPVLAGVGTFELHDEFYHHLSFPADRTGWTPLLTAPLPGDDGAPSSQTVAWVLERAVTDGGPTHRAVGFTGGHFQKNLPEENVHRFLLNAVTWAAGVEIPVGGVRTFDELWTPADRVGSKLPYETEGEPDWVDGRVRDMEQGPWVFSSVRLPGGEVVPKAVAVGLPGTDPPAYVLIDTETGVARGGWHGRFLAHSDRRFGLIDLPTVGAALDWKSPAGARWLTGGKPAEVRYAGLSADGDAVTLHFTIAGRAVRFVANAGGHRFEAAPGGPPLSAPPGVLLKRPSDPAPPPADPAPRWGEPLVTGGTLGEPIPESAGAFAVDTVALPFENPWNALLYLSGLDFTPDGTAYVAAAHGDVWQVKGLGGDLERVEWRRFATGLYQPLGLAVRDGDIFVLGRDRITRLTDVNADGEADRYESFNADLDVIGRPHAYAMGLETDAAGNFYFLKSGDPKTAQGGCLVQVTADGAAMNVLATGFRHPNGIGVSPPDATGTQWVTAADNEGNWIPATPLHRVNPAAAVPDAERATYFAGYVPTAHRRGSRIGEPDGFDRPALWLPRAVDTSAGGQVWVPDGDRGAPWGPLAGAMLHLSYGRCTANLVLTEPTPARTGGFQPPTGGAAAGDENLRGSAAGSRRYEAPLMQGAAMPLPGVRFLSGVCRGRFFPGTADLWVCGLDGWQTAAVKDGCLQRLRRTDRPLRLPTAVHARAGGLELRFAAPLSDAAADPTAWRVEAWTYRRSADYGSPELRPSQPDAEGHDRWPVAAATRSPDRKGVFLSIPALTPVMQYSVVADLTAGDADVPVPVRLYGTLHALGEAWGGWE